MDPLSDVLSLLKPVSTLAGGMDVGGPMSLQFVRHTGVKCYALVSGQCWLAVEGVETPVLLQAGDCFLLPHGRPFRLASDLALEPVDASVMYLTRDRAGGVTRYNGGGDVFMVGGFFALAGEQAGLLLGMLPPIVHIQREADRTQLRWSMERMMQELRDPQPGSDLIVQHLAHMLLVQALRVHLNEGVRGGVGWLFALADRPVGAAIGALHAEPARRWTVQALAEHVGLSRSTFAERFKATVGSAPLEYLTRWRMLMAADRLAHTGAPVSAVALDLGYESESAFSTAFKRVMGCSPRRYARGERSAPAAALA